MIKGRREASACLLAAFVPVDDTVPAPRASHGIKHALQELDHQATMLINEIRGDIPFHDTLHNVIEHMK